MADLVRLNAAIAYIEQNPDLHFQGTWLTRLGNLESGSWCGTAGCVAGIVVLQAGAVPQWPSEGKTPAEAVGTFAEVVTSDDDIVPDSWHGKVIDVGAQVLYEGQEWSVAGLASKLLDLNWEASTALFAASNGLDDIRQIRDHIAAGRGAVSRDDYVLVDGGSA